MGTIEPTRRDAVTGAASAALLLGLPRFAAARAQPLGPLHPLHPTGPWFRISLAQWSLHRTIRSGELDALGFARMAREEFGIDAIEYVNQFFFDKAGNFKFLNALKQRADDNGVESLLIMIDGEGALGDADDKARRRAVEKHFKWIAAARYLGCHSIRVNAAGSGAPEEQARRASDSLHRLGVVAEDYGIDVIVENHGGYSSDGGWLAAVIEDADHPRVGTLPDFGNFHLGNGNWYDRYLGVVELMPFARAVSAKSHEFDADGNEINTDYEKMLTIVHEAGYRGWIGIEYEGGKHTEIEGIRLTQRLLQRLRGRVGESR